MKAGIVVVLYEPDTAHVKKLTEMFCAREWQLILVDNSVKMLNQDAVGHSTYIHCGENIGIAEAQNIGLRRLFSGIVNHAFLLDQDSLFTPEIANTLLAQFNELANDQPIAAIGPSIYCQFTNSVSEGVLQRGRYHSEEVKLVPQIIASGMLLSRDAFSAVGEKESALFIDGVDHEWCWRARKKGLSVYQSLTTFMPHRQGDARKRVLGLTFKQGSPIRLFYQFRNILVLVRRGYVPLYWKVRHISALPIRYVINRYCFDQGEQRAHYMQLGFKAGLRNLLGSLPKEQQGRGEK